MSVLWPLRVSPHALERAEERLLEPVQFARRRDLHRFVRREVREALDAGRVAKRRPRWLAGPRSVAVHGSHERIAWSEDERRAYVLMRQRREQGYEWVVKTVLVSVSEAA